MPKVLKAQLHAFLHEYKRAVFELEHDPEARVARERHANEFVDEVLDQKFHYHFHQKVDPERVESIQLIHNYCREALLPPVISRLAERVLLLEQKHLAALDLVEGVLAKLTEESEADRASKE